MNVVLEGRGLRKTYRGDGIVTEALRGVDLTVERGEFVSIMGPSGCGKSSLLNLLGALDVPTEGEVLFEGNALSGLSDRQLTVIRRQRIGFIFQFFNLIPVLNVEENIAFPAVMDGKRGSNERVDQAMTLLGLTEHRSKLPSQLSGGEQQRTAIARALVNDPDVLLVDEPTGNLDSASADDVMAHLRRLHENGQTIVLVTHDPTVASRAARVLFMRDGTIVEDVDLPRRGNRAALISRLLKVEGAEPLSASPR
jgi:putative ABC transport system ATP-binding protein